MGLRWITVLSKEGVILLIDLGRDLTLEDSEDVWDWND